MTEDVRVEGAAAELIEASVAKLDEARRDVEAAEKELEAVLSEIQIAPRAEKTAVSRAIEHALSKLRAARTNVAEAETVLAGMRARK